MKISRGFYMVTTLNPSLIMPVVPNGIILTHSCLDYTINAQILRGYLLTEASLGEYLLENNQNQSYNFPLFQCLGIYCIASNGTCSMYFNQQSAIATYTVQTICFLGIC